MHFVYTHTYVTSNRSLKNELQLSNAITKQEIEKNRKKKNVRKKKSENEHGRL